jgi:oxygen-independent coproporphyrinogen-3 oxidase
MAGLYIHIPFCASRCIYCGFYSTTSLKLRQQYVDAVCREMILRRERSSIKGTGSLTDISTIYLGGGTPSQLTPEQLRQLFLYINKVYNLPSPLGGVGGGLEITIEMNPDDVTPAWAVVLPQLGINRVSMGAQTFDNERLRFLHRRHTAAQVQQSVSILRDAGIGNISIDLMYGFPNETLNDWQRDIEAALSLGVEHISAYCLMVEEGTPLYKLMNPREGSPCDEELERQMYEMLIDKLTAAGYEHYEISNFAKPGYRSRHNSSYWQDIPYMGLGAAAHSYTLLGGSPSETTTIRSWNVADIHQYIETIERGELPSEQEVIDNDTHYNDRITVALRTSDGLDLTTLSDRHRRYCLKEAQNFLDDGLLQLHDNRLSLTRKGLFVSDYIMSSLIMV